MNAGTAQQYARWIGALYIITIVAGGWGESHVPNLLCSCAPRPSGPLIEAVIHARGGLPPSLRDYEPTLIDRFLTNDAATIREEIRVARGCRCPPCGEDRPPRCAMRWRSRRT